MKNTNEETLEKAIEIAKNKNSQINIEYKRFDNEFFYVKISSTHGGTQRNIIINHGSYSDIDGWNANDLAQRIIEIENGKFF